MQFLYNFFIRLYSFGISVAARWNPKAAQWKSGRKNLWRELDATFSSDASFSKRHSVVWIHAASAGEFEQAKPVLEALKKTFPKYKILVTAFSPSGYPAMKGFALADYVFYLPLDTARNAQRFVATVQPAFVIFVKYDYWYHHLKAVRDRGIPLLLIAAIFRENQVFFKWYGNFYVRLLHLFMHLFVQDETSHGLLKKFGVENASIAGDTRFDRVLSIAAKFEPLDFIKEFCGDKKIIVAGSTWPDDEQLLYGVLKNFRNLKLILAPHEITEAHVKNLVQLFQKSILYSGLKEIPEHTVLKKLDAANVLIIDNIGMLSRLYKYATVTYIGGGFGRGIHNTLEAAVFGKPVIFGPNYKKFREAKGLLSAGAAFTFKTEAELKMILEPLLHNETNLRQSSAAAANYVKENSGATQKILDYIQEKRLLTN